MTAEGHDGSVEMKMKCGRTNLLMRICVSEFWNMGQAPETGIRTPIIVQSRRLQRWREVMGAVTIPLYWVMNFVLNTFGQLLAHHRDCSVIQKSEGSG